MKDHDFVKEFYALTVCGVWKVSVARHQMCVPEVRLIVPNVNTVLQPGIFLSGGTFVTIANEFIGLHFQRLPYFTKEKVVLKCPENLEEEELGEKTPKLLACFLSLGEAIEANKSTDFMKTLGIHEDRTKKVLREIGPNHPVFVVCRGGVFGFPVWYYREIGIDRNSNPTFSRDLIDFGKEKKQNEKNAFFPAKTIKSRKPKCEKHVPTDKCFLSAGDSPAGNNLQAVSVKGALEHTPSKNDQYPSVFFEIFRDRPMKTLVDGKILSAKLSPGKYEMIKVNMQASLDYLSGYWWIVKDRLPCIIGNTETYWSHWFDNQNENFAVRRTSW